MGEKAPAYRLLRKRFAPLLILIFLVATLILGAVVALTSPGFSFKKHKLTETLPFSIVKGLNEQESLRDSEPLFLPTEYSSEDVGLAQELANAPEEFPGFGRISVLTDAQGVALAQDELFVVPTFSNIRDFVLDWRETETFGEEEEKDNVPVNPKKGILLQVRDVSGTLVGEAELAAISAGDASMLPAPVEMECYGGPTERRIIIVQSSGDAAFDAAALAAVREWARQNLRSDGFFSVSLGQR